MFGQAYLPPHVLAGLEAYHRYSGVEQNHGRDERDSRKAFQHDGVSFLESFIAISAERITSSIALIVTTHRSLEPKTDTSDASRMEN
jgi:hypothetical protein